MCADQRTTSLSSMWFPGSNAGLQAWQQGPLPSEPSGWHETTGFAEERHELGLTLQEPKVTVALSNRQNSMCWSPLSRSLGLPVLSRPVLVPPDPSMWPLSFISLSHRVPTPEKKRSTRPLRTGIDISNLNPLYLHRVSKFPFKPNSAS